VPKTGRSFSQPSDVRFRPIADARPTWEGRRGGGRISNFEFLLSLFGLLLGFTLVEVLSGLVKATKTLRTPTGGPATQVRVGWLTPLLALFVILDIASYWANVWWIREHVPVGFDTVFGSLLIAAGYYFAASMVFPDDAQAWPELDAWFWLHRRQVLGPLFVINAVWISVLAAVTPPVNVLGWAVMTSLYFVLLGLAFFARKPAIVGGALGLFSFIYLLSGAGEFASRFA
jgi:hypothetical protein